MKRQIKIMTVLHCAMCVRHNGESVSEVEAGETLKLDWQPSSGWGLQEAHYTDDQDQVVQIDLSTREFTMPDYDIVIEGTAKRFTVQDWTTNSPENNGKVLGIDENGNVVPVPLPTPEEPSYTPAKAPLVVGADGKPLGFANASFEDGKVTIDLGFFGIEIYNGGNGGNGGYVKFFSKGTIDGAYYAALKEGSLYTELLDVITVIATSAISAPVVNTDNIRMMDNNGDFYDIKVVNGQLTCTQS